MAWYELLAASLGLIFGGYGILWAVPGGIILFTISHGSFKHIIYLDKQLAKNLDKYYGWNGHLLDPLTSTIGCRYMGYCLVYPFIRYRVTTKSKKFKVFMWVNTIGFWSWIILGLSVILLKLTGYMP